MCNMTSFEGSDHIISPEYQVWTNHMIYEGIYTKGFFFSLSLLSFKNTRNENLNTYFPLSTFLFFPLCNNYPFSDKSWTGKEKKSFLKVRKSMF